jgi:peptidyl-prolyl cis-trans isomerase C
MFKKCSACLVAALLAVMVTLLLTSGPVMAGPDETKTGPAGVVAIVNGVQIPESELIRLMSLVQMQLARQGQRMPQGEISKLRDRVLDRLIGDELLYQETIKEKVSVDKLAIKDHLLQIKNQYPSAVEFERAIAAQGFTETELLKEMERATAIRLLLEEKFEPQAQITDEQVKKHYDDHRSDFEEPSQIKARHILISAENPGDAASKEKARARAQEILNRIKAGDSFEEMAKTHSSCPSAAQGGDLGYFPQGRMVKEFEDVAMALEPGQMSDLVETQFGYHIIRVDDKKAGKPIAYEQIQEQLKQHLFGEKMEALAKAYVDGLKDKAKIEVYIP